MNAVLWVLQGVLAAVFVIAGARKLVQARSAQPPELKALPNTTVRTLGVIELLGVAGLILPGATGIAPVLTPLAATGLAIILVLAGRTHLQRREHQGAALVVVLLLLAVFVAVGRFGPYPL